MWFGGNPVTHQQFIDNQWAGYENKPGHFYSHWWHPDTVSTAAICKWCRCAIKSDAAQQWCRKNQAPKHLRNV